MITCNCQVLYNVGWKFCKFNKVKKAGLTSSKFQYLVTRSSGVNMFVQHHRLLLDATLLASFQLIECWVILTLIKEGGNPSSQPNPSYGTWSPIHCRYKMMHIMNDVISWATNHWAWKRMVAMFARSKKATQARNVFFCGLLLQNWLVFDTKNSIIKEL